jgi:hypothetical protein
MQQPCGAGSEAYAYLLFWPFHSFFDGPWVIGQNTFRVRSVSFGFDEGGTLAAPFVGFQRNRNKLCE